jgi:ABC-type transport system involved in multi-copper enzyme maturation permease subunit
VFLAKPMQQLFILLRHTAMETLRARTLAATLGLLFTLTAASFFLRELAIADSWRLQTTFLAAASRLACVIVVAAAIIGAVVREFNEQVHLLLLSLPLGRTTWLVGRFCGFALVAMAIALLAGLPQFVLAHPAAAATWTAALALELVLVAAMALFAASSLRQPVPALALTLGFYVLARAIGSLELIAREGTQAGWLKEGVHLVAALLPRLDGFAASARLVGEPGTLLAPLVQTIIYGALLLTAAAADVARRDL